MPAPTYTRNQILNQNTNDFPNNNAGLITPAILRDYNANVANSVLFLDETGSQATSASYALSASYANNASTSDQSTSASYAITASYALNAAAVNTGSLLITASAATNVITFTKGDNSTFSVTVDTGSGTATNTGSLMVTGSVTNNTLTFTKGDNTTFSLTVNTGSAVTVNTGSLMVTGSVTNNTLTFTKGDNTTFSLTVNTGSAVTVNTGSLLLTASISDATITFTKGDNTTFSQTVNNVVNANTASLANSIPSNLNITASNILVNNNLIVNGTASFNNVVTVTGSAVVIGDEFLVLNANPPIARYAGILVYDSGSATTASLEWDGNNDNWIVVEETGLSALILTGPTGSKGSEVAPTVNTLIKGTGHHTVGNSNITDNGTTVQINSNTQITGSLFVTAGITGSLEGSSSYALTASFALSGGGGGGSIDTGSFATTGSNVFTGDQVVNGLVLGRSGGDLVTNTAFGSASLSANIAANNVAIGYKALELSNDAGAESNVAVGSEALKVATNGFHNVAVGFQAGSGITGGGQNAFVGLEAGKGITGGNNNVAIGKNTLNSGGNIDSNVAVGGQALQSANGSENVAIGSYAGTTITGNTNTLVGTNTLQNITAANNNVAIGDHAGSDITSGDSNTIIGTFVSSSAGASTSNRLIIGVGGNYATTTYATNIIEGNVADGLEIRTGLQVTGSIIATGSFISVNGLKGADQGAPSATIFSVSNQYPDYGIFFLEGLANDFYEFRSAGTPTVQVDPDFGRVIASQFTGSLDGTATSASFAQTAFSASFAATASVFIGIATSSSFASTASFVNPLNQSVIFSGSVRGEVSALSISSNTASLNCSSDNFFTLQLVQGTNTFINPTNINNGQTINLLVSTTGSATVSFPSSVKQVSGNTYTPTTTTSKDVLTFISFADNNLYLVNVKNLV